SAEPFVEAETAAATRTARGLMDGLTWWSEDRAHASADPRRGTPDARSVIALAFPYPFPSALTASDSPSPLWGRRGRGSNDEPRGRIASYALGRDYHGVLLERMLPLVGLLRHQGYRAKTYVDHGWMLDRAAAARAGIGWLGKNTNLLVPGTGSYVLLAEIVTSAELETDEPIKKSCGSCDACIRACPTGALVEPGVLDNRRCISFWTIEHRGVIPREMRPLIGDWIFGCDLCQEICPVNAAAPPPTPDAEAIHAFGPLIDARPRLEDLLAIDDEEFRDRFRHSAVWRTRRSGLLRNTCIALGNAGNRSSVPSLEAALGDREPLIRGHAAWALGRLGGASARRALEAALSREDDAWVREECELALEDCGPLAVPSAV
ncbi:MAG TPA: tRNA epoxyqueuosine(34) reductase QueG, partial [Candidatus Dormibacteraeota bacterium]|nr:tRNA epoxyqueuosine(34) reductase QueG [Candidatus Dormibacteraeota bacterium]